MYHRTELKNKLEYARFMHLLMGYIVALYLFLFTNLPHKQWIILTVLVISAGIEPGLILKRCMHRINGTLAALLILLPLLYLMQINYRFVPIVFVIALIGMAVTSLKPQRYDITVFFITIVVFLLISQTSHDTGPEGPFEMVLNRGICTFIGIGIVLLSDYFLFNTFQYSQKLYLYHQLLWYDLVRKTAKKIKYAKKNKVNTILFTEKLRTDFIHYYAMIDNSAENLLLDLKTSDEQKQQIQAFQQTIWQVRRRIFALNFSELMAPSPQASKVHWQKYEALMKKAQNLIIQIPSKHASTVSDL